jgi:hypothetical protein
MTHYQIRVKAQGGIDSQLLKEEEKNYFK